MRGAFGFQIINGGRMNYENVKNSRYENRLKSVNESTLGYLSRVSYPGVKPSVDTSGSIPLYPVIVKAFNTEP